MDGICIAVNVNELWLLFNRRSTPFCPPSNRELETPSPRLRSPGRVLENFRSFAKSFVVSTFTAQKKPVGWLAEIHLVAGAGRGEAEEPERSDGNRLYGSIADKKAVGSKSITAFYDNKKSRNLLRPRLLFLFGSGYVINLKTLLRFLHFLPFFRFKTLSVVLHFLPV